MDDAPQDEAIGRAGEPRARLLRGIARGALAGLVLGGLTGLVSLWLGRCRPRPPLPDIAAVPVFQLTDQNGESFGSAQLSGHPWIAGFVFSRCTAACPLITMRMASLQRRLRDRSIRLVSFTVDPVHDSPAVLRAYGERAGADFSRWSFLTGPPERIRTLVTRGFLLTMASGDVDAGEGAVVHDERLVLVDQRGHIRGYYGDDADSTARLARDARRLAN